MTEKIIYLILALILVSIDLTAATFTRISKRKDTIFFEIGLYLCAFLEVTYTAGLFITDQFWLRFIMGLFFSSIPITLMFLLMHVLVYTGLELYKTNLAVVIIGWAITTFDTVLEIGNAFNGIVMRFSYSIENSAGYVMNPSIIYQMHLIWCYIIIAVIVAYIAYKIVRTPAIYRRKYYVIAGGLVFAAAFNGICLIFQKYGMMDYSQTSYSLLALVIYWDLFRYSKRGIANINPQIILDDLVHPIIIFSENEELIAHNKAADFLLKKSVEIDAYSLESFIKENNLNLTDLSNNKVFQWDYKENEKKSVYRVDYTLIADKNGTSIGKMFTFTDNSIGIDILTGFQSKNAFFQTYTKDYFQQYPVSLAILDINKLSQINKLHGIEVGDKCIHFLANTIRDICVGTVDFIRLDDANLLVIQQNVGQDEMRKKMEDIKNVCRTQEQLNLSFEVQTAVSEITDSSVELLSTIENTYLTMRSRKLLDSSSAHTSLLDSMAQAMIEADETTEEHVVRTRNYGDQLGKRLGFSDLQLSNLSLLCLMHDIGKLGIPVEILNKPGKLTKNEWEVMKSHTNKGYKIAKASPELEQIADCILHHHEFWNGNGYPDGLRQESIPLLSRVISIVDAYDAMTNDRPYHKAISEKEARAELLRCSGIQFDPYLVSEFVQMLDESYPVLDNEEKQISEKAEAFSINKAIDENKLGKSVHLLFESSILLDEGLNILTFDSSFEEMTGYSAENIETYHLRFEDLLFPEDMESVKHEIGLQLKNNNGQALFEHRIRCKYGRYRFVITMIRIVYDNIKHTTNYAVQFIDSDNTFMNERVNARAKKSTERQLDIWKDLIRKDSMTGILNHEAYINDVEMKLLDHSTKMVFFVLDVDHFKEYNDQYGHMEGDKLLILIANVLEKITIGKGLAGRLGGDEFSALICFQENEGSAESIISGAFSEILNETQNFDHGATVSIGAVEVSSELRSFNKLYKEADAKLYQSKNSGRKKYSIK